ncbi:hypothetical protein J4E83_007013 [Alternaria metachromatica]|uniref:uncharacterized protein n=1 Tax=Alternaria metachromatica TaxID=283354 RepID=UPI0020C26EC9|nr:uncharacterized protein J4E83_007013 [Alternaria metachromatica]KAI4615286.1 hypothetical protein J4E83_007013 [Alternaria metachromatica]
MDELKELGQQLLLEAETGLLSSAPNAPANGWHDPEFELPYSRKTWSDIEFLLTRRWFRNISVVRDYPAQTRVEYGNKNMPLHLLINAIYCLYSKKRDLSDLQKELEQAIGAVVRLPVLSYPRLLHRASTFKRCTDPRDKIYGTVSVAPRKLAASISLDYDDSNTEGNVYASAMLAHAKITQRFELFHNCFFAEDIMSDDPSWVPNFWSEMPGETYIPAQFAAFSSRAHFTVINREKTPPNVNPKSDILRVLGLRFAEVSRISTPLPAWTYRWGAIRRVREWQPDDIDRVYSPTNEPMRKAYALTLNCNITKEREPDWMLTSTTAWVDQDFGEQALFGRYSATSSTSEIRSDVSDAVQCCGDRLFFRTNEGYIGLGPSNTQAGDIIAVSLGCSTPLALRPSSRGPDHYTVIGECFIYGIQDGNLLLGPLPQPWTGIAAWAAGDRRILSFLNTETQGVSAEDLRLCDDDLDGWERTTKLLDGDDLINYDFFRNKETGELINYDPRLEPEKLEKKGVKLEWFSLV